jgi:hypothetical protein
MVVRVLSMAMGLFGGNEHSLVEGSVSLNKCQFKCERPFVRSRSPAILHKDSTACI